MPQKLRTDLQARWTIVCVAAHAHCLLRIEMNDCRTAPEKLAVHMILLCVAIKSPERSFWVWKSDL